MKVVILAGGFGTRIRDVAEDIPKPMIPIGPYPILWHIMQRYAHYGYQDFFIALGYKAEVIKNFFFSFSSPKFDTSSDFPSFQLEINNFNGLKCKVTLVDTGLDTMTGGRLKRMKPYIGEEIFMLTYGDGLADIDINLLVNFHKKHEKMVTVTAVHPAARFGELDLDGDLVKSFQEKPQVNRGWINGGFFVCQSEFINLISDDTTILERDPLEKVSSQEQLMAFKHEGFWQCMDTKRDKDFLEELWIKERAPWKI